MRGGGKYYSERKILYAVLSMSTEGTKKTAMLFIKMVFRRGKHIKGAMVS